MACSHATNVGTRLCERAADRMGVVEVTPDFKPEPRTVDRKALARALVTHREQYGGKCIACKRNQATVPHHIVYRSGQGDDVEENIAPLCDFCHRIFHYGPWDEQQQAAANIGKGLRDEMVLYVLRKMGVVSGSDYLRRRYLMSVPGRLQKAV